MIEQLQEPTKELYVEQLCAMDVPLKRIKLKLFGHSMTGKTRLTNTLQSGGVIGSLFGAVSRRFTENVTSVNGGGSGGASPTSSPQRLAAIYGGGNVGFVTKFYINSNIL